MSATEVFESPSSIIIILYYVYARGLRRIVCSEQRTRSYNEQRFYYILFLQLRYLRVYNIIVHRLFGKNLSDGKQFDKTPKQSSVLKWNIVYGFYTLPWFVFCKSLRVNHSICAYYFHPFSIVKKKKPIVSVPGNSQEHILFLGFDALVRLSAHIGSITIYPCSTKSFKRTKRHVVVPLYVIPFCASDRVCVQLTNRKWFLEEICRVILSTRVLYRYLRVKVKKYVDRQ